MLPAARSRYPIFNYRTSSATSGKICPPEKLEIALEMELEIITETAFCRTKSFMQPVLDKEIRVHRDNENGEKPKATGPEIWPKHAKFQGSTKKWR